MESPSNIEVLASIIIGVPAVLAMIYGLWLWVCSEVEDRRKSYYRNRKNGWYYGKEPHYWC